MPQRYKEEVQALVDSLIHSHEKDGLLFSAIATLAIIVFTVYLVDGLMRLGCIGG